MAANNDNSVNTPENATVAPTAVQPSGMQQQPSAMKRFIREVLIELKKTNWPSRDELTKFTMVVIMTIVIVAVFLYIIDAGAGALTSTMFGITSAGANR